MIQGNPKIGNQGTVPVVEAQPTPSGLLQQDFTYQENTDGANNFPLNLDYFIPVNCQKVVTARLSFRLRAYRTYSNFSVTGTSNDSTDTTPAADATGESGHSHNHTHDVTIQNYAGGGVVISASTVQWQSTAGTFTVSPGTNSNAAGSSGHSHNHTHGAHHHTHNHTVSGSSFLGVTEGAIATSVTVKFDGVDQTANMIPAGPYVTDQVEIDVTKFISTAVDRSWHTIALKPSALGRIQAVLRILYNSNQV